MLHILTGRAGSGKTKEIYRRMVRAGKDRPQLLLVPEQASFEAEQRLCRENGNRAGLYGEVLTFTRLENRVLSLAGGGARLRDAEEKAMAVGYARLLRRCLRQGSRVAMVRENIAHCRQRLAELLPRLDTLEF